MSSAALASSSSAFASRRVARASSLVRRAARRRVVVVARSSSNLTTSPPGASSDGGDADADARRRDERTDDVARAVLEFHAAEGNGNGARGRGGERVVPLASFARRYGWSESRAEGVLWQSDVPARAFGVLPVADEDGTSTGAARAARTVDAAVAYEGMWRTFVETDAVVDALARATARGDGDGDGDGARKPARGHLTKRRALDDALASLRRDHPASCFPEGGASLAAGASSTTARWNEFLRALRRRYGASASAWPFALLTKKIKRRRVYACAAAASFDAEGWTAAGWDVVLRGDARVERGGFGVRGGIGRGGSDASPVAAAKAAVAAASEAAAAAANEYENDDAARLAALEAMDARRVARAATWKVVETTETWEASFAAAAAGEEEEEEEDEEEEEEEEEEEATAAAAAIVAKNNVVAPAMTPAERRRRARLGAW